MLRQSLVLGMLRSMQSFLSLVPRCLWAMQSFFMTRYEALASLSLRQSIGPGGPWCCFCESGSGPGWVPTPCPVIIQKMQKDHQEA